MLKEQHLFELLSGIVNSHDQCSETVSCTSFFNIKCCGHFFHAEYQKCDASSTITSLLSTAG